VCYPAKLVHGHIIDLLEKDIDAIFYPCMSYTFDEGISDNCYNCPVVAYYPELIQANITDVEKVHFLYPHLGIENHKLFAERMYEEFKNIIPRLTKKEMEKATENAFTTYYEYRENIRQEGSRVLKFAEENNYPVIILASRPYHIDPEINHGLDRLLNSLQFVTVTEDALYPVEGKLTTKTLNQWGYHARMYNAAKYVSQHKNMELVHLVSFGCGIDAITTDEIQDILRSNNKLYTQLKIDEVSNLGAAKIRLRSLQATMREREI
jgi:possible 2-hydroxyglutaryl-coA dehydratase activator subunit